MNKTARGSRFQIGIYGRTNSGKSSLVNAIFKKEISIVSDQEGTTTDPVYKNIELDGLGPLCFIDTAGLMDGTDLGDLRIKRTLETLEEVDLAIYLVDPARPDLENYRGLKAEFDKRKIQHILVCSKLDRLDQEARLELMGLFRGEELNFVSSQDGQGLEEVLGLIRQEISQTRDSLLGGLVEPGASLLLVVSIDSEYPSSRLILPQSQLIREALGNGNLVSIVRQEELEAYLAQHRRPDLIVADSKIFKDIAGLVGDIGLTSFSILMANYKGDVGVFIEGIRAMEAMRKDSGRRVLIYEVCNHTANHEDIGRVKIPRLLRKIFQEDLEIDFAYSKDFSQFKDYDLLVHCGGCMENRQTMLNKIRICQEEGVALVNYGMLLAYGAGILDRAVEIFK